MGLNRSTYILISTHICHKPRWQNWLGLHSANSMVVGSNPAACYSKFCYFFILALPFFLLFLLFPYLPKGIFPFPSNLRQPQLGSNGKCKIKPGIPFWGWTPSLFFSKTISEVVSYLLSCNLTKFLKPQYCQIGSLFNSHCDLKKNPLSICLNERSRT